MNIDEFVEWWTACTVADLEELIAALPGTDQTAGESVRRIIARSEVDTRLRRLGLGRRVGPTTHRIRTAVLAACARTGVLASDRSGATRLARAAGDAGRGLLVAERSAASVELLRPFAGQVMVERVAVA